MAIAETPESKWWAGSEASSGYESKSFRQDKERMKQCMLYINVSVFRPGYEKTTRVSNEQVSRGERKRKRGKGEEEV